MVLYKKELERLVALVQQGKLFHAYLFFGDEQGGGALAMPALCNFLERNTLSLPEEPLVETMIIEPLEEDGKKEVGIDQIREASMFLHTTPVYAAFRTVIFPSLSELTIYAQQALLKIVEEPPLHGLVLASVKDPSMVLPTLASRFQQIYLSPPTESEVLDFIIEYGRIGTDQAQRAVTAGHNSLEQALAYIADPDLVMQAQRLAQQTLQIRRAADIAPILDRISEWARMNRIGFDAYIYQLIALLRNDARKNAASLGAIASALFFLRSLQCSPRIQLASMLYAVTGIS
jgi:DNA polymerase III delta prime subunit